MKTLIYSACIILATLPTVLYAQPEFPDTPVPLDGGLMALLAAGAVYGVKAYRKHNTPS